MTGEHQSVAGVISQMLRQDDYELARYSYDEGKGISWSNGKCSIWKWQASEVSLSSGVT
jgi:hypothetical protein